MIASVAGAGRWLMAGSQIAVVVAMAMVVGCAESAEAPVPLEPSILDLLDERAQAYEVGERYLLSLVVPPGVLAQELQVSGVWVNDPTGDASVDSGWVRPRIVQNDCTFTVSRGQIPLVEVAFSEGPSELTVAPDEGVVYSVWLALLDDANQQRDVFEVEEAAAGILATCSTDDHEVAALLPEMTKISLIDIGHPGFALRFEDPVGVGHLYQYAIGDRVVLQIRYTGSSDELDVAGVEELLGRQLERLQAAGLDVSSGEGIVQGSATGQADGSDVSGSGAFDVCGVVADSGLERDRDASVVVVYADSDASDERLRSVEVFLASSVFVDDFRVLSADGLEPTRLVVQMEPTGSEETVMAVAEELRLRAGVAEVVVPADC